MKGFAVNSISAGYGAKPVIENISFELENGCVMGILGANGSGKTTLIKSICGILPHEGSSSLDGIDLGNLSAREMAKKCSYIPQRSGISIDISAMDVVLMGFNPRLRLLERPGSAMQTKALQALEMVGLGKRADDNYMHLSEGQKQLCILARTLVSGCRLLLLDEPESALDFRLRYSMLDIIRKWVKSQRGFGILALHDPMLALNYCDKLMLLKDGKNGGILSTASDTIEKMEEMLAGIYGPVSLVTCNDRTGGRHIVMLKEREEASESGYKNSFFG